MKKYTYKNIGVDVYKHTCKNGLEVYMSPNKRVKSFYASLCIRYGSNDIVFKVDDELIEVPKGSAHFLEHKMFEQEDGITPFDFYSELGVDCNASTSYDRTSYIFFGSKNYTKSLKFLLDYVASPYFTLENVEKEKGIIKQEILMYEDEPGGKLFNRSLFNTYSKNNIRYLIGGKVSDIMKITKEDLYNIYNAFYEPENMYLVVTGNFDMKKTIEIAEKNKFKKKSKVSVIYPEEKLEVSKKYEEIKGNIVIPKFAINIKVNIKDLKDEIVEYKKYLSFYLETVLGPTSLLKEKLLNKHLITSDLSYELIRSHDYMSIIIMGETEKPEEVIKEIMKALKKFKFDLKEFNLNKKTLKSYYMDLSDNIFSINSFVTNQIFVRKEIVENMYLNVDKLNKKEYNRVISSVDFDNYSVVIMRK